MSRPRALAAGITPFFLTSCAIISLLPAPTALAKNTPFLPQSWMFDYAPSAQQVPIPTTEQCETIDIAWSRGSATGPSGTAPYNLVVYTSSFVVPLVVPAGNGPSFSWAVPFTPGTQYQICMFDKNGNTGGCQRMYTVITNPKATLGEDVSCRNLTYPQYDQVLDVDGAFWNSPISQYGWPDQCTDIQLTPKNGTPPYTVTIAPMLHPPYNITSKSMDPINWTVSLNWGQPFFLSIVDSKGNSWAQGPLHAGQNGPTDCLDFDGGSRKGVTSSVVVGSTVAGLIAGSLLSFVAAWFWLYRREHPRPYMVRNSSKRTFEDHMPTQGLGYHPLPRTPSGQQEFGADASMSTQHAAGPSTSSNLSRSQYHIDPFVPPNEPLPAVSPGREPSTSPYGGPPTSPRGGPSTSPRGGPAPIPYTDPFASPHAGPSASPYFPSSVSPYSSPAALPAQGHPGPYARPEHRERQGSQVYVVHHDGGRAPVTVYTADGTEVVELPPSYGASREGRPAHAASASGSGLGVIEQRRQPNAPRKERSPMRLQPMRGPGAEDPGIRPSR